MKSFVTSYLSCRQRKLLLHRFSQRGGRTCLPITIIQDVKFDDTVGNQESLIDFLDDKVLALPLCSRVKTLSLKCKKGIDPTQHAQVNRRLSNVLKRGVVELILDINAEHGGYSLPFEVFTCKTVVMLDLGTRFTVDLFPENTFLPALQSLTLGSLEFDYSALEKLFSAFPVLTRMRNGRSGGGKYFAYRELNQRL